MADDDTTANNGTKTKSDAAGKTSGDDTAPSASTDASKTEDGKTQDSGSGSDANDADNGSESGSDSESESGSDGNSGASGETDSAEAPGSSGPPPLSTALNPQIVQAVGTTNHAVLNGAIPGANGVAYQKVSQAAAYAVQDSTDYMRNIMSMASATTGVAMQKMLAEKKADPYSEIIKAATQAVTDAQKTFSGVGEAASTVVKDFDNLA